MQIVIDINDEIYKEILNGKDAWSNYVHGLIRTGTPLPKGHGQLGDLDALRKEISSWGMNDYEPSDFIDEIDRADVIIEADKEQEE